MANFIVLKSKFIVKHFLDIFSGQSFGYLDYTQ